MSLSPFRLTAVKVYQTRNKTQPLSAESYILAAENGKTPLFRLSSISQSALHFNGLKAKIACGKKENSSGRRGRNEGAHRAQIEWSDDSATFLQIYYIICTPNAVLFILCTLKRSD
jgi:hypothetical protein